MSNTVVEMRNTDVEKRNSVENKSAEDDVSNNSNGDPLPPLNYSGMVDDICNCCNYQRKTKTAALLWFFFGLFGIHHLYLQRYSHFVRCVLSIWIISNLMNIGSYIAIIIIPYLLIWLIDGFRIKNLIKISNFQYNERKDIYLLYDIYLFWLPPFGIFGFHHFYMKNYWKGFAYLFSCGLFAIGWLFDLFLISIYYYKHLKSTKINYYKSVSQSYINLIPFGSILGIHHAYCGDITLAICYFFSFGGYFFNVFLDIFYMNFYVERYNKNIDKQIDEEKNKQTRSIQEEDDEKKEYEDIEIISNTKGMDISEDDDNLNEIYYDINRPFIFKKERFDAYRVWIFSWPLPGLHHLYMHNWIIFVGHILTLGGCGIMWLADFFLIPWFIDYSNYKLGYNQNILTTSGNDNDNDDATNNETNSSNIVPWFAQNKQIEFQRDLYITYLYWMPPMGFIGVYYIYLGEYYEFIKRFFTFNYLAIGWCVDFLRIFTLVKRKMNKTKSQKQQQKHALIN